MIRKAYYLSEPQLESIQNICNDTGLSEAEIVRRAIDQYIEDYTNKNSGKYKVKCGIYALIDPRNDKVMYIGKSIDIDRRIKGHLSQKSLESNIRFFWIEELKREGLTPRVKVIKECEINELDRYETEIIKQYKSLGQAELNITPGGQSRCTNIVLNTNPDDWVQVGQHLREGYRILLHATVVLGNMVGAAKSSKYINMLDKFYFGMDAYMKSEIIRILPKRSREIIDLLEKSDFPDSLS